jgi:S-DNA-T family DNA segregation ATPase FtsK/SpoIIIE
LAGSKGYVCPKCGLDYDTVKPLDTIRAVRSFPYRYRTLIKELYNQEPDADDIIRRRPEPGTWSALEYTAHVAHVIDQVAPTIRRMVVEDNPTIPSFDSEERVDGEGYNDLPVPEALSRLDSSCSDLGMTLDGLGPEEWVRTGQFPFGERDALAMARNAVHEGSHHLRDIERGLGPMRTYIPDEGW